MNTAMFLWYTSRSIGSVCLGANSSPRPNILFVFADDWDRQASADAKIDGPDQ
jgi:hypothetical protein